MIEAGWPPSGIRGMAILASFREPGCIMIRIFRCQIILLMTGVAISRGGSEISTDMTIKAFSRGVTQFQREYIMIKICWSPTRI
jgi:hypothetical protein